MRAHKIFLKNKWCLKRNMAFCVSQIIFPGFCYAEETIGNVNIFNAIHLKDSTVRPDYIEIERIRNTKEVIIITKEDIQENGMKTFSEVLNSIPGISVNTSGAGQIDIRGQGADQASRNIQVMLDGMPITNLVNHPSQNNYDVIPIENIERIEIIPGGGSVLYGSGASGGIVNITTNLRSMDKNNTSLSSERNSNGYRLNVNVGGELVSNLSGQFSYSHLDRELYFVDTYRNSNYYSAGLKYRPSDYEDFIIRASKLEEKSKYVYVIEAEKLKKEGRKYKPAFRNNTIGLDRDGRKINRMIRDYLYGDRKNDAINISYNNYFYEDLKILSDYYFSNGFYIGNSDENKKMDTSSLGAKIKFDWSYSENANILLGVNLEDQKAKLEYNNYQLLSWENRTYKMQPMHFIYDKKNISIFLLNNYSIGEFEFSNGLRRERTNWSFDKNDTAQYQGRDASTRWNSALELAIAYNYRETGKVHLRYERGYTLPDGIQITDSLSTPNGKVLKATSAKDEVYDIYEIGMRDKIYFTTFNTTLWMSNTNNQINRFFSFDENGLSRRSLNLLESKRWGADLVLSQTIGKFSLEEQYSYLMGRTKCNSKNSCDILNKNEVGIDYSTSGLKKVPKNKFSIKLKYDFNDKASTALRYTYFGSYNNFFKNSEQEDSGVVNSHKLLDTSIKWELFNNFHIFVGINNVLNERYYDYASTDNNTSIIAPGQKRNYYLGFKAIM